VPPDVLIKRCELVVRRRGGWSWGPDPRRYLEAAMPALERAITEAIAEAGLPPDADGHLDEPVRLRLGPDGRPDPPSRAALVRALREHGAGPRTSQARTAAQAPAAPVVPVCATPQSTAAAAGPPAWPGPLGPGGPVAARALAGTLGRWSRTGRLAAVVGSWPPAVTAAWLAAFEAAAGGPAGTDATVMGEPAVARIAAAVLPAPDALPGAARALVLLGAVVAATGDRPPPAATLRTVHRVAASGGPAPASPAAVAPSRPPPAEPAAAIVPARAVPVPDVVPALPFLVLIQLYRIGYLDGLMAAAAAAGLPDGAAALAAALAGKCLPPPDPDGDRAPADQAAILAAAGLPAGPLAAAAGHLHRSEDSVLEPLRAALTGCYAEGPAPHEPLVVSRCPDGVVCGERAGALPIAWVRTDRDLAPVLAQLGRPPVRFADTFAAFAAEFSRRRAFPGLPHGDLERHLGAAAGTALGSLAAELWPRQAGDAGAPLLALDRLGDLEARIDIAVDRIGVGIPRGRRWMELGSLGLLDAWPVPWAPGGRWELVTW